MESHPTIVTTTPGEFLETERDLPKIDTIGTGSWVDGTLSTWAGEAEESLGWQRLVEARKALVAFETDNPNHPGLDAAWESLYIAEGSDWYWWYGLDQDSGYDENWDVLFKVHLVVDRVVVELRRGDPLRAIDGEHIVRLVDELDKKHRGEGWSVRVTWSNPT